MYFINSDMTKHPPPSSATIKMAPNLALSQKIPSKTAFMSSNPRICMNVTAGICIQFTLLDHRISKIVINQNMSLTEVVKHTSEKSKMSRLNKNQT